MSDVTHSLSLMQASRATWQVDCRATFSSPDLPFSLPILSVGRCHVLVDVVSEMLVSGVSVENDDLRVECTKSQLTVNIILKAVDKEDSNSEMIIQLDRKVKTSLKLGHRYSFT